MEEHIADPSAYGVFLTLLSVLNDSQSLSFKKGQQG